MDVFICTACGTQYPRSSAAPRECLIGEEERNCVPPRGQTWTTLAALAAGHFNSYRQYEPGVIGIPLRCPAVLVRRPPASLRTSARASTTLRRAIASHMRRPVRGLQRGARDAGRPA